MNLNLQSNLKIDRSHKHKREKIYLSFHSLVYRAHSKWYKRKQQLTKQSTDMFRQEPSQIRRKVPNSEKQIRSPTTEPKITK